MCPITFYRKNRYKLCLFMVWYELANPNQTTTTAVEVDEEIDRL